MLEWEEVKRIKIVSKLEGVIMGEIDLFFI